MHTLKPLIVLDDHLATLENCHGYYDCPKDATGKRLGPLVGYTARYDGTNQWVGDTYANFAMAEEYPDILRHFANQIINKHSRAFESVDVLCAAPMGGILLATALALGSGKRLIYAEKKVLEVATSPGTRDRAVLVFGRHHPYAGESVGWIEDMANNLSTTGQAVELIAKTGASMRHIFCFLNRSLEFDDSFNGIPINALVRKKIGEYRQDDPFVADDIARGNVVLNPKPRWNELIAAMHKPT
jgi:orotate phosphoribosyltransferase